MIYLDNAATTRIAPDVLAKMMPYLTDSYGNPGSAHALGKEAKAAVDKARKQVADFIGASPRNIIFTASGSEANSMVFNSVAEWMKKNGKTRILTDKTEHDSVLRAAEAMCIKHGFHIDYLPVNNGGIVNTSFLADCIRDDTGLVSVMYVNNETGAVNNIFHVSEMCREKGVLFHTDCVQAAPVFKLDASEIGCDFLTISSHKIHGPKGAGALYSRSEGAMLQPSVYGGEVQEFGLRGGTENVAAIVGFGAACERGALSEDAIMFAELFEAELRYRLDESGRPGQAVMHLNTPRYYMCGTILNVRFDGVDAETLLSYLSEKGVYASAGSACRGSSVEPSAVLLAAGLTEAAARSSLRFSFSDDNTPDEIKAAAETVAECVSDLRALLTDISKEEL